MRTHEFASLRRGMPSNLAEHLRPRFLKILVTFLVALATPFSNAEDNLLAHWKLDDASGTTAADSSGNGLDGTLGGDPQWASGKIGGALDLDGTGDYVDCGDILNGLALPFTFASWVYRNDEVDTSVVSSDDASSNYVGFWVHITAAGNTSMNYGSGAGTGPGARRTKASPNGVVAAGEWVHLAYVVRGPTDMDIYVNGSDVGGSYSGTGSGFATSSDPFYLGRRGTQYFNALLDDVRVYNKSLTQEEILALLPNVAPIANDDAFGVLKNGTLSVAATGVLGNDTDFNVDSLSAAKTSNPASGTLNFNANGSFEFTPAADFVGQVIFTYKANDGTVDSNEATVTIEVEDLSVATISPNQGGSGTQLTGVVLTGTGFRDAGGGLPVGAASFNGHAYLVDTTDRSWAAAKTNCESLGGHLATVASGMENAFLTSLLTEKAFLGMTDAATEGTWAWITGEAVTFTNWGPTEPNNGGDTSNEDHLQLTLPGTWNDIDGAYAPENEHSVCEWEGRGPPAVKLRKGADEIIAWNVEFVDSGELHFDLDLTGAAIGLWDVVVIQADNGLMVTLAEAFEVQDVTPPVVTALSFTAGATLGSAPAELVATLSEDIDPATVTSNSVVLTRGGPDLTLGTGDDVTVPTSGLSVVNGKQIKLDLTGVTLPDDRYRLTLSGTTPSASPSFLTDQSTSSPEEVTSISQDGLELFFFSDRPGGTGYYDLYTCTRPNKASPWSAPVEIVELNTDDYEGHPIISRSGLSLYFTSIRAGGAGDADLWMATRSAVGQPWENPVNLTPLNSSVHDQVPIVSLDELTIWFISQRPGVQGSYDIFTATRPDTSAEWGAPTMVTELNTNVFECPTWVSIDGRTMYLISARSGSLGGWDIWRTTRPSASDPWTTPENVSELNSASDDGFMTMNTGEDTVWFSSKRPGTQGDWDIMVTQIDTAVRDSNGVVLDGEFSDTFPSGDGTAGGNFVAGFTIDRAPVANNDSADVDEGQSVTIDVAGNDTDVIDALDLTSILIISGVSHGSLQVNNDGTVDYTHDGSENFSDSFTYTIDDQTGATSNAATISISINAVNDKPLAGILGSDPFYVEDNVALPFDGTGTDAEDGTDVTYVWDWDDGTPDGTAQSPSHAWDDPGLYIVTLVVTDQDGLASDPVTVQVIVTPKAGERDLFLKRGKFLVNWKVHNDGVDKDAFSVQGWLNPAGINATLNGATFELSVGGVSLGAVPLAANGKGAASFGAASAKASLKAKTGAFSYAIKDADLRTAIGLANTTEAGDVELAVEINVPNAGLDTETYAAHALFAYTTTQDATSKGNFNFKTADSADGYFFAAKTTVTEDKTGAHKVSVKGYFDAPGGASLVPAGDLTLTVGAKSITVPAVNLMVSGGIISLPKGAHPDLAKFILDTNKELFTIQTNALAGTGVPLVGNPAMSHDLLVRIEIPTAGDSIVFGTTVEILRSSPTSKVWKR